MKNNRVFEFETINSIFHLYYYKNKLNLNQQQNIMFIRTLKVFNKKNQPENDSSMYPKQNHKKLVQKQSIFKIQSIQDVKKLSAIKLPLAQSSIMLPSSAKNKFKKLVIFQNQYTKQQPKRDSALEERKQNIKQKIKRKVQQQLADLLKRSENMHSSLTEFKIKHEFTKQSNILNAEIKGNSFKRSLKTSFAHRPEILQLSKINKFNHQQFSLKQSVSIQKNLNAEQSPKEKIKQRRSLSNIIHLHQIATAQKGRWSRPSALGQRRVSAKKDSVQIDPWQYVEQY